MTPLLSIALEAAVPLHIMALRAQGGPTEQDWSTARDFGIILAEKGDVLQFGGKKRGEAASLFNQLARSLAVLAFLPGGSRLGELRWEVGVVEGVGTAADWLDLLRDLGE